MLYMLYIILYVILRYCTFCECPIHFEGSLVKASLVGLYAWPTFFLISSPGIIQAVVNKVVQLHLMTHLGDEPQVLNVGTFGLHLSKLMCKPKFEHLDMSNSKNVETASRVPINVPSSRYHSSTSTPSM